MTDGATMVALGEDYPELRELVRRICERYPGEYLAQAGGRAGLSDRDSRN